MGKTNVIYEMMHNLLQEMAAHPESVTKQDKEFLARLQSDLNHVNGISEHFKWKINYVVEKWHSMADKLNNLRPYEVVRFGENIVLDNGANEMLKLLAGNTTATAYNNANAKIYVGADSTAEAASQTGILATGANRAYANLDSGYPTVSGRILTFRASFGETEANFAWNEASITNGTGASAVALNRKVSSMGVKNGGTWTINIQIQLLSA